MPDQVYRDSVSAWRALRDAGGLEVDERDEDLVTELKARLDPASPDLETALQTTSTDAFLQALFETLQPFVAMFRDVLQFFERAGAREGQLQWRVVVDGDLLDLRHFEEFLAHWDRIETELEVPVLDQRHAFILNNVRLGVDTRYLIEDEPAAGPTVTGVGDVDAWLVEERRGMYAPFPPSLYPDRFPPGLSDAASVVFAAVSIIRDRGITREEMLDEHRARSYRSVKQDALHPWTIAQSETDFWLRSHVTYLAKLLGKPQAERDTFAALTVRALAPFPRRRLRARVDLQILERLLSLPIWRKRYEVYGVWIATQIVGALDDHDVAIEADNGELKFAFREAKIATIKTVRPWLALFAERRTSLANPISPHRTANVQPDFGVWTESQSPECRLVVEVKHYRRRSRRNFRDALIDYAAAHPRAAVALVNYGPVGTMFNDLPTRVRDQCHLFGPLTPETFEARKAFRQFIRDRVGDPVVPSTSSADVLKAGVRVAIDVSWSMAGVLASEPFAVLMRGWENEGRTIALIDETVRCYLDARQFSQWHATEMLGHGTSLALPVAQLLVGDEAVLVVTDASGLDSLRPLNPIKIELDDHSAGLLKLARVARPTT